MAHSHIWSLTSILNIEDREGRQVQAVQAIRFVVCKNGTRIIGVGLGQKML